MHQRPICSVEGCDREARSGSCPYCNMHYQRLRKHGDPAVVKKGGRRAGKASTQDGYQVGPADAASGSRYVHRQVLHGILGPDPRRCEWCGELVHWEGEGPRLVVDHLDRDRSNNDPRNLRVACDRCNRTRGDLPPRWELVGRLLHLRSGRAVAGIYGVDGRTVRRWFRKYGFPALPRGGARDSAKWATWERELVDAALRMEYHVRPVNADAPWKEEMLDLDEAACQGLGDKEGMESTAAEIVRRLRARGDWVSDDELMNALTGGAELKAEVLRRVRDARRGWPLEARWPAVEVRESEDGGFEYAAVRYEPVSLETPWMRKAVAYPEAAAR